MNSEDSWLNKLVPCPNCKELVRDGNRIWLDGTAYCPQCYEYFRRKYYSYQGTQKEDDWLEDE